MKKLVAPLLLALLVGPLLAGCGLRPLYAQGSKGEVAGLLRDVSVSPIPDKEGWLVRNALRDRLEPAKAGDNRQTRYRLDVKLDDDITGFGIRRDAAVTRERRTLRARYQLVDTATNVVLLDQSATVDAGIDVVGSEYATIAAEDSALERLAGLLSDQIVSRLALFAARHGTSTEPAATPLTPSPLPPAPLPPAPLPPAPTRQ